MGIAQGLVILSTEHTCFVTSSRLSQNLRVCCEGDVMTDSMTAMIDMMRCSACSSTHRWGLNDGTRNQDEDKQGGKYVEDNTSHLETG